MTEILDIRERLFSIRRQMEEACRKSGRDPNAVTLVCVTKKQPLERINMLLQELKEQKIPAEIGENYVQEFLSKKTKLTLAFRSHLIGPLQSNKSKEAVAAFDVIQSVHSEKILRAISKEASHLSKNQEIFLQVNISNDPAKSGLLEEDAMKMASLAQELPGVTLKGIMTISALYANKEEVRGDYRACALLARKIELNTGTVLGISMGMSNDFDVAIEEGATIVRIGSALLGDRS